MMREHLCQRCQGREPAPGLPSVLATGDAGATDGFAELLGSWDLGMMVMYSTSTVHSINKLDLTTLDPTTPLPTNN